MKRSTLLLGACLALPVSAHAAPPPASAYAEVAVVDSARLSPDGTNIAFVSGAGETLATMVANVDTFKTSTIPNGFATPNWVRWKDNQTLLVSMRVTTLLEDRVPIPNVRLVALSTDGSKAQQVDFDRTEDPAQSTYGDTGNLVPNVQDDVVSIMPNVPGHILVQVPWQTYVYQSVFDVNLWGADKSMTIGSFRNVVHWAADQNGLVRAGVTRVDIGTQGDYKTTVIARSSAGDGWHTIDVEAEEIAFSATDPNSLFVLLKPKHAPASVVQFDIPTGTLEKTFISGPEGTVRMLTQNGLMVGYSSFSTDGSTNTYTDPDWAADAAAITGALKIQSVLLVDRSADGKRAIAVIRTKGKPDTLWMLDRSQNPANLAPVLSDYPNVPAGQIAPIQWSSFTARDGLVIPVLVTVPVGGTKGPIPFVVLPHGGPTSRDYGDFNYLAQFFASRGYGVLQPQFRGSIGFGADFEAKGKKQWGLAMQDDVTDATRWLISQNLADPKKICIVGDGYAGYAALEGTEKEPGLYACAAAIAPVTDLPAMIDDRRNFEFSDENIPEIGDDTAQLEATSPDQHADRIQIPVLLIHGREDGTVSVRQTEKMEAALKAAGKSEQTIYLPNADHQFQRPGDRLAVLNALEAFLSHNLGGS